MQSNKAIGPPQPAAQLFERNARRVGGEHGIRSHLRLGRGIDLALQLEHFRHRLDDEIGGGHACALEIGGEAVERVADLRAFVADLVE